MRLSQEAAPHDSVDAFEVFEHGETRLLILVGKKCVKVVPRVKGFYVVPTDTVKR